VITVTSRQRFSAWGPATIKNVSGGNFFIIGHLVEPQVRKAKKLSAFGFSRQVTKYSPEKACAIGAETVIAIAAAAAVFNNMDSFMLFSFV